MRWIQPRSPSGAPRAAPAQRLPAAVVRWLAPSAGAACAGVVVAGGYEALGAGGAVEALATIGFVALLALPSFFVLALIARGLVAAWQPRAAIATFVEPSGSAPGLAAWLLVLALGMAVLGVTMFAGTWILASITSFRVLTVGFGDAALTTVAVVAIVLVSLPVARGLTRLGRALDERRTRAGKRPLLRPRIILGTAALVIVVGSYVVWAYLVEPMLGTLDLSILVPPALGLVAMILVHGRRRAFGLVAAPVLAAAVAMAVYARLADPLLTLEIWGDRPVAGLAVDKLFDLDAIRSNVLLSTFQPAAAAGAAHPDIILVTIDTVRADHTPPYFGRAEMPTLRALAERGVTFEWAFSPSNVTRRSIPSMVIGLAPNRLRGRVVGWALRVDPRYVLLAERLEAAGYDTAGFMCCHGFWAPEVHTGLQRGLAHLEIEPNGIALSQLARKWLDAREAMPQRKPLFLWMHILEPHNWPAASGEPHNDDERTRFYDRSLQQADHMLAEILFPFAQRKPEDRPIVIVTADHGEALGDHGQSYHSSDLYDSQTHVPLVMSGPGLPPARIPETVSLIDLVPTLVELAGYVPPSGEAIDGRSVADLARGQRVPDPDGGVAFAAMIKDRSNPGGIVALVRGGWKLIDTNGTEELFDIHADPGELRNRIKDPAAAQPLAELRALLKARIEAGDRSPFSTGRAP